jgi:hypothetical protein
LFVQSKEKLSGKVGLRLIVNVNAWLKSVLANANKILPAHWLGRVIIAKLAIRRDGAPKPE